MPVSRKKNNLSQSGGKFKLPLPSFKQTRYAKYIAKIPLAENKIDSLLYLNNPTDKPKAIYINDTLRNNHLARVIIDKPTIDTIKNSLGNNVFYSFDSRSRQYLTSGKYVPGHQELFSVLAPIHQLEIPKITELITSLFNKFTTFRDIYLLVDTSNVRLQPINLYLTKNNALLKSNPKSLIIGYPLNRKSSIPQQTAKLPTRQQQVFQSLPQQQLLQQQLQQPQKQPARQPSRTLNNIINNIRASGIAVVSTNS